MIYVITVASGLICFQPELPWNYFNKNCPSGWEKAYVVTNHGCKASPYTYYLVPAKELVHRKVANCEVSQ